MYKVETVYENDDVGIEDSFESLDEAIEFYNQIKKEYFDDGYDYITLMEMDEYDNYIQTVQSDKME